MPRRPSLKPTPEGVAPQDNKRTALVVGAVAATIVLAGVVGQAAAAAAADADTPPASSPIDLQTQVGSGPTTEPGSVPGAGAGPDPRRVRGRVVQAPRRRSYGAFDAATTTSPEPGRRQRRHRHDDG